MNGIARLKRERIALKSPWCRALRLSGTDLIRLNT